MKRANRIITELKGNRRTKRQEFFIRIIGRSLFVDV